MARGFVEDLAFQAMENAPMDSRCHSDSQQYQNIPAHTDVQGSRIKHRQLNNGKTPSASEADVDSVIEQVKRKVASNFDFYNQFLQLLTFPVLFPKKEVTTSSSDAQYKQDTFRRGPVTPEGFELVEQIELHELDGIVFGSQREVARGHCFVALELQAPTWCDRCGDFIWGVYKQCLSCRHCQLTVHTNCRPDVTLDCTAVEKRRSSKRETSVTRESRGLTDSGYQSVHFSPPGTMLFARADGGQGRTFRSRGSRPTMEELQQWELERQIDEFNNNQHGLVMSLSESNGLYQGFIRVYMNLIRPINMSLSRPRSFLDVVKTKDGQLEQGSHDGWGKTVTEAFYLPKHTSKVIHITSDATAMEVIKLLLNKFQITDNPRKFALYERRSVTSDGRSVTSEGARVDMRRLADEDFPLAVCLSWTSAGLDTTRFVLQENDTMEIMWEKFTVPELENFLRILDREQEEYMEQVKVKYKLLRMHMRRRMDEIEEEIVDHGQSGRDTL